MGKKRDRDEWKPRNKERRRDRNKFSKHLSKNEIDRILKECDGWKCPVLYVGEISLSRFNPNVAYINVDGLDRDIRISGFVDRNRAFHGDKVAVSIYPEIEWLSAIRPEIKDFQNRLDERDRLKLVETEEIEEELEDDQDVNEVILDELTKLEEKGYAASSSSASSDDDHNDKKK